MAVTLLYAETDEFSEEVQMITTLIHIIEYRIKDAEAEKVFVERERKREKRT